MRKIGEVGQTALRWVQVDGDTGVYELRARDEVVGTLFRVKAAGTLFAAVAADGRWTFKRGGFLPPHVTVRHMGEEANIATLVLNWPSSGKLSFDDGRTYQWRAAHRRQHYSKWIDEGGAIVVKLTSWASPSRHDATVEVELAAADTRDLSLLTMLGWYCVVLAPELSSQAPAKQGYTQQLMPLEHKQEGPQIGP